MNDNFDHLFAIAKPGDVVFVEAQQPLNQNAIDRIKIRFENLFKETGVKIIVLDSVLKVAKLEKKS